MANPCRVQIHVGLQTQGCRWRSNPGLKLANASGVFFKLYQYSNPLKSHYSDRLGWTTCRASSASCMCVSAQTFHPSSVITRQLPSKLRFDIRDRVSNLLLEPPCNSPERPTKLFSQRPFHLSSCRTLRCNLCNPTCAWKTWYMLSKMKEEQCRS